jgi:hypothetical protein
MPVRNQALARCLIGVALTASACTPAPTTLPSASPTAMERVTGQDCEAIDLRTPSGTRIDLTGTWRGGQTVVYVRQEAGCVWWMALSDWPGEALGSQNMLVFRGNVYPDFTLRGDWMNLVKPTEFPIGGSTTFQIDTDVDGATDVVELRSLEPDYATFQDATPYGAVTLIYVGPLPSDGIP